MKLSHPSQKWKSLVTIIVSASLFLTPIGSTFAGTMNTTSSSSSAACDYSNDDYLRSEKEKCLSTPGKTWSCEDNRCTYDQTSEAMQDTLAQCEGIEDATEKKKCFDGLAANAAAQDGLQSKDFSKDAAAMNQVMGWANLIFGALMGGTNSTCMSANIMKYTGLAQTATELYTYFFLQDKVTDLREEYEKKAVNEKSYDAQIEAFQFIMKEQQEISKVAKQRKLMHTVVAAGYTAAAGMALWEAASSIYTGQVMCGTTSDGGAMSCAQVMGQTKKGEDAGTPEAENEKIIREQGDVTEVHDSKVDAEANAYSDYKKAQTDVANAKQELTQAPDSARANVEAKLEAAQGRLDSAKSEFPSDMSDSDLDASFGPGSKHAEYVKAKADLDTANAEFKSKMGSDATLTDHKTDAGAAAYEAQKTYYKAKAELATEQIGKSGYDISVDKNAQVRLEAWSNGGPVDASITDQLGSQIKNNVLGSDGKFDTTQGKNMLMNAGKTAIQPWELVRELKGASTPKVKVGVTISPKEAQNLTYDLNQAKVAAEAAEITALNTKASSSDYRDNIKDAYDKWILVHDIATKLGNDEERKDALDNAEKWADILKRIGGFTLRIEKVEKIFAGIKFEVPTPTDTESLKISLDSTTSDYEAYIAFWEWKNYRLGKLNSYSLRDYETVIANAPVNLEGMNYKKAILAIVDLENVFATAHADVGKKIGGLAKGMAVGAVKTYALRFAMCAVAPKVAVKVSSWLQSPYAIAVMSTGAAALNFQLSGIAGKEQKQAENNAKIVQETLSKFVLSQAGHCPEGRDDLSNPACYCYQDDGERNEGRDKSETCQQLWQDADKNLFAEATKYEKSEAKGCVTIDNKFDLDCKCKKFIDKASGKNACMKAPATTSAKMKSINIPGFNTSLSKLGEAVASAGNGNIISGNVNGAELSNNALSQKKVNAKMAKQLNKALAKKGMNTMRLNDSRIQDKLVNSVLPKQYRSGVLKSGALHNSATSDKKLSPKANEALKKALKNTGIKYKSTSSAKRKRGSTFTFNDENDGVRRGGKVSNYMNKKYNYKDNDIVKKKGVSIFKVLSNRYNQSGLKRLFGEK